MSRAFNCQRRALKLLDAAMCTNAAHLHPGFVADVSVPKALPDFTEPQPKVDILRDWERCAVAPRLFVGRTKKHRAAVMRRTGNLVDVKGGEPVVKLKAFSGHYRNWLVRWADVANRACSHDCFWVITQHCALNLKSSSQRNVTAVLPRNQFAFRT